MGAHDAAQHQLMFFEHVKELRGRLAYAAGIFLAGAIAGYVYHAPIILFLKRPLQGPLYYDSPAGNFNLIMQVSFAVGVAVAVPVLVYNLVRFVEPALNKKVRKHYLASLTLMSLVLALMGAAFAYTVVLPLSLHFFSGFKVDGVRALISASSYMSFVIKCILAFLIIFQLPLVVLFINFVRPLPPRQLLKYEKYVIIGSLGIAVVLPFTYDPITQFVIAVPIIFLYNFSLLLVWMVNRKKDLPGQAAPRVTVDAEVTSPTKPAVMHAAATLQPVAPAAVLPVQAQQPQPAAIGPRKHRPGQDIVPRRADAAPARPPITQPVRRNFEAGPVRPRPVLDITTRKPTPTSRPAAANFLDLSPQTPENAV